MYSSKPASPVGPAAKLLLTLAVTSTTIPESLLLIFSLNALMLVSDTSKDTPALMPANCLLASTANALTSALVIELTIVAGTRSLPFTNASEYLTERFKEATTFLSSAFVTPAVPTLTGISTFLVSARVLSLS